VIGNLSQFAGQRILVTGASGFIGSHLCRRLHGCGAEVHAVSRADRASSSSGLRWWHVDLAESAAASGIVSALRPDIIFHLASLVTGGRDVSLVIPTLRSNLLSTINLLVACAEQGRSRLIYAGSMEEPVLEDGIPIPCSPYSASKWASTGYARMFYALYGLPVTLLRIFMVYGPGQMDTNKLIPYVIRSLLRDEAPTLSSGNRPVDWIFVDDVIDALMIAATLENSGVATLDIGSGSLVTVRAIVERVLSLIDTPVTPVFGALADRLHEVVRTADISATEKVMGWSPRVDLEEGLKRTVEWYKLQFAGDGQLGTRLTSS
jgi:nucleoside-diphosphate-sugar epimerase